VPGNPSGVSFGRDPADISTPDDFGGHPVQEARMRHLCSAFRQTRRAGIARSVRLSIWS
jgi:hypothetical protein